MSLSNLGLDAFQAIAELGTIVQASASLGVTQTALTQRIKSLEEALEVSLFFRSRKGMVLTDEGRILYQYCLERSDGETSTVQRIRGREKLEPLRLRLSGPTMQTGLRVLPVLSEFKKKFPHVIFTVDVDDSGDLFSKLRSNAMDLILSAQEPPKSLRQKALLPGEFMLTGSVHWKKRDLKEILSTEPMIDFNPQDTYTIDFLKRLRLLPKTLPERMFINNTQHMLEMVEHGLGYGVFDARTVAPQVKDKSLVNLIPGKTVKTNWYLAWNDSGQHMKTELLSLIDAID